MLLYIYINEAPTLSVRLPPDGLTKDNLRTRRVRRMNVVEKEEFRRPRKVHADNPFERAVFAPADIAFGLGLDAETGRYRMLLEG